jgi:thioredoxin-related protein
MIIVSRLLFIMMFFCCIGALSAQHDAKLYDPTADAKADLEAAVAEAKKEGKHVLIQVGGNWCSWCLKFHEKLQKEADLKALTEEHFVVYHLNFSKENQNKDVLADLAYPQRFGFPVFVILDGDGNRIHTQNSAYLEEGNGHSKKKILTFLKQWSPEALNPANY